MSTNTTGQAIRKTSSNVAAAEAAAMISTAVEPSVETAHKERRDFTFGALAELVNLYDGEDNAYIRGSIIEAICGRADYMLDQKNRQLNVMLGELRDLMAISSGGEIDDLRVQKKTERCGRAEVEIESWMDILQSAIDAYRNETGNSWYPRKTDPDARMRKLNTAAKLGASAMLERHGTRLSVVHRANEAHDAAAG